MKHSLPENERVYNVFGCELVGLGVDIRRRHQVLGAGGPLPHLCMQILRKRDRRRDVGTGAYGTSRDFRQLCVSLCDCASYSAEVCNVRPLVSFEAGV